MAINTAVYIPQLEAEVQRLSALAVRPKRIEWVDETSGRIGNILAKIFRQGDVLCWEVFISDGIVYNLTLAYGEGELSVDTAKAACQAAFDAWVMQFLEVGE